MPTLKVFAGLAVLLALTGAVAATRAQQPAPESCGDASDMAALIDCARKRRDHRAARGALSSGPAPMSWPASGCYRPLRSRHEARHPLEGPRDRRR